MNRRISDYFYENHETCEKEYKNNFRHSNHRSVLYIQQYPDKVSYFHVVCVYFTKMFFIHPSLWQRFNFQITQYIYIYIILLPQKIGCLIKNEFCISSTKIQFTDLLYESYQVHGPLLRYYIGFLYK